MKADPHLSQLVAVIEERVAAVITAGQPVALVNFPNHGNAGDPAIWLGTLRVLERLGCPVVYSCHHGSFSATALRAALPEGPVLINGGGNFGDLYGPQQALREHLLVELRDRHLVQLPQSIHFQHPENFNRVRRMVAAHGNVTVMVRDAQSKRIAADFDTRVVSCPDLALGLGRLPRPRAAATDVLWLERQPNSPEHLSPGAIAPRAGLERVEWLSELAEDESSWPSPLRTLLDTNRSLTAEGRDDEVARRRLGPELSDTFEPLATAWVDRGLQILSRGRVVVTERLHGHLLSLCLGVPHVVLDNSYGKCRSTYDTWTGTHPLAHWASSAEEALCIADRLLQERG